jgi:hypothetical protein
MAFANKVGKYGNKKSIASDGSVLDSKRECKRYEELLMLQKCGEIRHLSRQEEYILIPAQPQFHERDCRYRPDFCYYDKGGKLNCEDSKGAKTKDYIIKRKLMAYMHQIKVEEV